MITTPIDQGTRVYADLDTMRRDMEAMDDSVPYSVYVQIRHSWGHGNRARAVAAWRMILPLLLKTNESDDVSGLVLDDNPDMPSVSVRFPEGDNRQKADCDQVFLARWLSLPPQEYAVGDNVRLDLGAIRREIEECDLRGLVCYFKGALWKKLQRDFEGCKRIEIRTEKSTTGNHLITGSDGTCGYEPCIAIEPRFLLPGRQALLPAREQLPEPEGDDDDEPVLGPDDPGFSQTERGAW